VTAIIPVFNRLPLTRDCLDCLRAQTHAPLDVLVVDGGSTDGTQGRLAWWQDWLGRPDNPVQNRGVEAGDHQARRVGRAGGDDAVGRKAVVDGAENRRAPAIGIERADGRLHEIFKRNASVPNQKSLVFTTGEENQEELVMRIFQGDTHDRATSNDLLGEFTFSGIRKGPRGAVKVEVIFDCNVEGILTMSAQDKDTGKQMKTTVKVTAAKWSLSRMRSAQHGSAKVGPCSFLQAPLTTTAGCSARVESAHPRHDRTASSSPPHAPC
jgi:hypothetical protein